MVMRSVADPDPGSGAFLTPGSGIRNGFILFRIPYPKPIFLKLCDNFLGKKFCNSLKIEPKFFLQHFKNIIIFNFVKFVATKKRYDYKFFHPSLLVADFGSGINIPDPQHWLSVLKI
jgi:hypothetical protein